jgi:signal peptidase
MRRAKKLTWYLIAIASCTAWAFTLRPQSLGGPAGYVMVRGISMLPTYHTNDLVITRQRASYSKGDIVAYRVPSGQVGAGIVVIHRIIGGSGSSGYVVPGDIVGKAWLLGPQTGRLLLLLRAPIPLASIAAGIAMAIVLVPQSGSASGGEKVSVLRMGADVVADERAAGNDAAPGEADVVQRELDEALGEALLS